MQKGQRNQEIELDRQLESAYRTWVELVKKYSFDAQFELWTIYKQIAHVPSLLSTPVLLPITLWFAASNANILQSSDFVYIYTIRDVLSYYSFGTGKTEAWPILDKTLWPRSCETKHMPDLPSDVWGCILARLCTNEILQLSRVCKDWNLTMRADRHWSWRVRALCRVIPRSSFPYMTHNWQYFAYLNHLYQYPNEIRQATQTVRNKWTLMMLRFNLPIGLPDTLKWRTKKHEPLPAGALVENCLEWVQDEQRNFFMGRVSKHPDRYYMVWNKNVCDYTAIYPNLPHGQFETHSLRYVMDFLVTTPWTGESLLPYIKQWSIFRDWDLFSTFLVEHSEV